LTLRRELGLVLTLAAVLTVWQLFAPPIVGLADQGDFVRLLGPLGYAPVPKGPAHKYWYLTRTYVKDPSYREPRWEQPTSEFIPARIAMALNRLFGNPDRFDITLFGFTHTVLFLLALARLFYVTRSLAMRRVVWALTLLVLTDVGYASYWNSLYTEPASCLWFLFFLAESIDLCNSHEVPIGAVLRWNIFAVLWIAAKSQNAALSLPLAVYGLGMLRRTVDRKTSCAAVGGVVAICLAGVIMYRSLQPAPRVTVVYNAIFFGILPESPDPQSDLKALGLDPGYTRYSGTVAWSPGTGVADGTLVNTLLNDVSSLRLVTFYLKRPRRMWRHIDELFPAALSLRAEFCGNFDRSARRLPGARSDAIALWSRFHERGLLRIGHFLIPALILAVIGGSAVLLLHRGATEAVWRWTEFAICLAACCLTGFFAAAFGDAWEPVKHQFLFNLLLDTCLVFGIAVLPYILCPAIVKDAEGKAEN
jgi:hypothetical protein